jgi:hypothetical protein
MIKTASRLDSIPLTSANVTSRLSGTRKRAESYSSFRQNISQISKEDGENLTVARHSSGTMALLSVPSIGSIVGQEFLNQYRTHLTKTLTDSQYNPTVNSNNRKLKNLAFSPVEIILPDRATAANARTIAHNLPCQRIEGEAKMGAGKSLGIEKKSRPFEALVSNTSLLSRLEPVPVSMSSLALRGRWVWTADPTKEAAARERRAL